MAVFTWFMATLLCFCARRNLMPGPNIIQQCLQQIHMLSMTGQGQGYTLSQPLLRCVALPCSSSSWLRWCGGLGAVLPALRRDTAMLYSILRYLLVQAPPAFASPSCSGSESTTRRSIEALRFDLSVYTDAARARFWSSSICGANTAACLPCTHERLNAATG